MITARRLLLSGAAALLVACGGGRAAVKPERVEPLAPEAAAPDVERPRPRAARVLAPSERIDEVLAQARGLLDRHDDPLTHVGVVEEIEPDGTVQILHRANRGIVRDPMNLLRPHQTTSDGKRPINAILRPKGRRDPAATPHLLSELWAGFGTVAASPSGESREGPSAPLLELLACGCEAP